MYCGSMNLMKCPWPMQQSLSNNFLKKWLSGKNLIVEQYWNPSLHHQWRVGTSACLKHACNTRKRKLYFVLRAFSLVAKLMTILFGHPTGNPNSHHAALAHLEAGRLEAFCVPWMPTLFS